MHTIILGFITAFTLTYAVIPSIIKIARQKKLFDAPNERSSHEAPTPSLGGIGIFAGVICSVILWTPSGSFNELQYILAAAVLLFLLGVKDDLISISPMSKFLGQIICAVMLVYKSDIRVTSLYGIFGIETLPETLSFVLSVVAFVGIINAFNLIDGINGLAGSVAILACVSWGTWFILVDHLELAILAFSLTGALLAFLKYNITPARIFMGDTGSMFIGLICAVLAIKFIELQATAPAVGAFALDAAPAIAIAILILPLYDTARVFTRRLLQGKSPFHPDKSHLHHLLLDTGLSHMQATAVLIGVNILFIAIVFTFQNLGNMTLLAIELLLAYGMSKLLYHFSQKHRARAKKLSS